MEPITKSVIRKLFRMKLRLIGISLVISLAMAMFVAGFYGSGVMESTIDGFFEDNKMPDLFIEFSNQTNSASLDSILSDLSGVQEYDLRLKKTGVYNNEGELFIAIFIGVNNPENEDIAKLTIDSGSFFSESGEAIAVIGMESEGLFEGKTASFEIAGEELNLEITGTVSTPEFIFTSAYSDYSLPIGGSLAIIFMDIEELEDITEPGINDVIVLLGEDGAEEAVLDSLDDFEIKSITYQKSHSSVTFMAIGSGKLKSMFPLMGTIFMLIGFISIFMTIMRLIQNDSRYIGVLMSLGYKKSKIVKTYLLLGLVISSIGCIIGVFLSIGMTKGFVNVGMSMYMSLENVVFPFDPYPFIAGILYTVVVVLFSVWVPVHIITRTSVREALEYKPNMSVHLTKINSNKLSKVSLMGLRNTTRNPARFAITVFVVALTLGVAGSWLVMADSAFVYMSDQIEADTWDLRADFTMPLLTGQVDASTLKMEESDIEYIITFSYLMGELKFRDESKGAVIIACDEMGQAREFEIKDGELDFDKAVITTKISDELGVDLGDVITLEFGSKDIDLEIGGIVYDIMAYTMYTSKENIASIFPTDSSSGAFIKLKDPAQAEATANSMRKTSYISKVVVHSDISETIDELMEMAAGFMYGFFFFNAIITIVVAGSAVIISTMERDVEFATLDTLGISRKKVAKSILAEMAILAIFSSIVGIPFAYIFAKLMAVLLEEVVFYFPVVLAIGATLSIFLIGMIFVLMSSIVPIRYSKKLDTEKTIRERTAG